MDIHREQQLNPVSDEVLALTAVVRPILRGVLYGIKRDIVNQAGGYDNLQLKVLGRLVNPSDGDVGVCFEYAVHEALNNGDARVVERVGDALRLCGVPDKNPSSLLFGMEKDGSIDLIQSLKTALTDETRVLSGQVGQPPKLKKHLNTLSAAFRRSSARFALPSSIRGLWKADLFLGSSSAERFVGTSVKINPSALEGAAGLRVGIVPVRQGATDKIRKDEGKNLIVCPLPHDADFMQTFYEGWRIVQAFLDADSKIPKEVVLPRPVDREVCRILFERREYPVLDVVEALKVFAQPELLTTAETQVTLQTIKGTSNTRMVVAPVARAPKN